LRRVFVFRRQSRSRRCSITPTARGREIGSDRLEVELALLACHWYGPGVLQPK